MIVRQTIDCGADSVWNLVSDLQRYPSFMESVESVDVVGHDNGTSLSHWTVRLRGSVLRWVERDRMDPVRRRIDYHQVEGDLARFEGYWQLEPLGEHRTLATLVVDFEIGIPLLDDMLNPVATAAIRENCTSMLRSLDEAAVGAGRER